MQREVVREYEEQTVEEEEEIEEEVDMEEEDEEEKTEKETPSDEEAASVSSNVISAEAAAASTLALYKDVINDFLGVINFPKFNQENKLEEERRPDFWDSVREAEEVEVEEEEEKEEEERFQGEQVSQYSYGSFLSEVYRVTLERMKQRVKI